MKKIVEGLFQGNMVDAISASKTKTVDWIVYVGQELPRELSHESFVPVVHVPLKDGKDDLEKWRETANIIQDCFGKGRTLVACRGGISRSPMMVVFWLKAHMRMNFEHAFYCVQSAVPEMMPEQHILSMVKEVDK